MFTKPQPLVLNRAHPYARWLVGAWPMQERSGMSVRDSTRKIAGTLPAGAVWHPDRSVAFSEQLNGITTATPANLSNTNVTMWSYVYLPGNSRGCFMHTGSSPFNGYSLGVGWANFEMAGNDLIALRDGLGWDNTVVGIGFGWHSVAYMLDAAGASTIWLDGKLIWGPGGVPLAPADAVFYIGGHPWSAARGITGRIAMTYVFNRPLTAAIMRSLHVDPYALYRGARPVLSIAFAAGTATIRLTWDDIVEHEDGFSIERDTDGGGFGVVHVTAAGVETWDDTLLPLGHTYTYRVQATSAALGDSEYSNEAEVII